MAIEVKFGKVSSPKIKVNKTMTVTATVSCTLIEPTDVSAPVLRVDAAQITNGKAVLLAANYVQIADFGRYYFITDRVAETTNDWLIYLAVDVLKSFSSTVTGYTGHIARSQSDGSWMLPDGLVPMNNAETILPHSFLDFVPFNWSSLTTYSLNLVLCVAGGQSQHSAVGYPPTNASANFFAISPSQLRHLGQVIAGDGSWATKIFQDTESGVFSCKAFPFAVPHHSSEISLTIGKDTPRYGPALAENDTIKVYELNNDSTSYGPRTLRSAVGDYHIDLPTDFRAVTASTVEIFLPFVGWKTLDPCIFQNRPYLDITYEVDIISGIGICKVFALSTSSTDSTNLNLVASYEFNAAIEIPLTISNASEIARNTVQTLVSSITSIGIGAAAGGWAGAGVAAVGAATSVGFAASRPESYGLSGVVSGNTNKLLPKYPTLIIRYKKSPILDSSTQMSRFAAKHGIRFDEVHALSTVSGFTVVDNPEPDMPEGITEGEYGELKGLMSSGIII